MIRIVLCDCVHLSHEQRNTKAIGAREQKARQTAETQTHKRGTFRKLELKIEMKEKESMRATILRAITSSAV